MKPQRIEAGFTKTALRWQRMRCHEHS